MAWANIRVFLGWENSHMRQISADNHTKEDGPKEELSILQDNLGDQVQKKKPRYVSGGIQQPLLVLLF